MSQIKLKHSGGNSVIIAAPDSNPASDVTLKLPNQDGSANEFLKTDGSGNLAFAAVTNSPAFSVRRNANYNPANGSEAAIQFDTERFDTDNCFDTSTYRFTPNVAGNYVFHLGFYLQGTSSNKIKSAHAKIRKNTNDVLVQQWHDPDDSYEENRVGFGISAMATMNGSSDYVEARVYCLTEAGDPVFAGTGSMFGGFKLI